MDLSSGITLTDDERAATRKAVADMLGAEHDMEKRLAISAALHTLHDDAPLLAAFGREGALLASAIDLVMHKLGLAQ